MKEKSDQLKIIVEKFLMDISDIIYSAHLEYLKITCDECGTGKLESCCDNSECEYFRC